VWESAGKGEPVPVQRVEHWIDSVNLAFNRPLLVVDPWQMESTIQKYSLSQPVETFQYRGGQGNHRMAENLRTLVLSRRIRWPSRCGWLRHRDGTESSLASEMTLLITEQTAYDYRFQHTGGQHDDRCTSVAIAALYAAQPFAVDMTPTLVRTPIQDGWSGAEALRGFLPAPPSNPGPTPEPPRGGEQEKDGPRVARIKHTFGGPDNPLRGLFGIR
jgi:hypothetical protein